MQKFLNQILTDIQQIEMQLPNLSEVAELETIIQQLIRLLYQLFECIDEIQNDFSLKEEQFKAQIQQKQEDITLTLEELNRQKQYVVTIGDLYQKLEEQSTTDQLSYDLQIQGLESKLKEYELSQVSLKLNFEQTITQFKESLYQKDLDIQEKNMKLQTLIEQCLSSNSQTTYTINHKKDHINSIVSLQNLEAVEQENIFEISRESNVEKNGVKPKNEQSCNSLKTVSLKQVPKLINSKCELDDPIFKFGTQQLNSQFVSKMHTRHNSFGYNFDLIPLSQQKETPVGQQIKTNEHKNIYQIFFHLISQCVKLDLQDNKLFIIEVNHLYDDFIQNNIPFNKWYSNIKAYLKQQK